MPNVPISRTFPERTLSLILVIVLVAGLLVFVPSAAQAQNAPPLARAGNDRVVSLGAGTVTLDGTRSVDFDNPGSVLGYRWEIVTPSYANRITITPTGFPLGRTASFFAPTPSEAVRYGYSITFRLTVTDSDGASGTDTVTFRFQAPPTAAINVFAYLPDPNATDTDRDGTIEPEERYTINAIIRRPGQSGNSQIEWTVQEGARLTVMAVGTPGVGTEDSELTYRWRKLTGQSAYSQFNIPSDRLTAPDFTVILPDSLRQGQTAVAHYTLTLRNSFGQQAAATVRISVVDEPFAPEVDLALANNHQPVQDANGLDPEAETLRYVVSPGASVALLARSFDYDTGETGRLTHTWSGTGVTPSSSNASRGPTSRATFVAPTNATEGQIFAVQALATDPGGNIGRDTILFIVVDNTPPVATAPPDDFAEDSLRDGTQDENLITITGTGADQDGDTLSYRWVQIDVDDVPLEEPTVELINADTASVSFVPPEAPALGELLIRLSFTVIDQWGVSDNDTVIITVLGFNEAPVADAGPNQLAQLDTVVRLDGTNSSDPDGNSRITSWSWEQVGFATTPSLAERPLSRFDELVLAGWLPAGSIYPDLLLGANTPRPVFETPPDIGTYTSLQFTFELTVRDSSRAHDTDTVTITVVGQYFSGVITGPDFCTNRSLGGPPTYPLDTDRDGVADLCSLRTTRREAIARQNALVILATLSPASRARFRSLVLAACRGIATDFGDDPAKLAQDACETSMLADPPPPVSAGVAERFFSGPVVTGPDFCTNFSLGGARLYPFDLPPQDGVADICVLPYTRREAIARQKALEAFTTPATAFNNALALACRDLGTLDFGDRPQNLARDACAT